MHMHASGRREAVRLWGPATSKELDKGLRVLQDFGL